MKTLFLLIIPFIAFSQEVNEVNADNINSYILSKDKWGRDIREFTSREKVFTPENKDRAYSFDGDMFLQSVWGGKNGDNQRYRDELSDRPWPLKGYPNKTEKWVGWRCNVLEKIDDNDPAWYFITQFYQSGIDGGPPIALYVTNKDSRLPKQSIGLNLETQSGSRRYIDLGKLFPEAGGYIDIVFHIVFSRSSNDGLLQLWIDGDLVYDEEKKTMFSGNTNIPNTKIGVYYQRGNNTGSYGEGYNYTYGVESIKQLFIRPNERGYGNDKANYDLVNPAQGTEPCDNCFPDVDDPPGLKEPCPKGMKLVKLVTESRNGGEYSKIITCVPEHD